MGRVEPDASQGGHGETVVKREAASPASLSGSAAEDEEHSTQHNKTTTINSDKTNLKIKIKMEDKSKCSKCLVCNIVKHFFFIFYFFLAIFNVQKKPLRLQVLCEIV